MKWDEIIKPSLSPLSSPVVLIKKKEADFFVIDRKLIDVTKKDIFPLPRIDDALDTLAVAKSFFAVDFQSGY